MEINALGYVGLRAQDLDEWTRYGTGLLGMQLVDRSAKSRAFRMDDRRQRFIVSDEPGGGASFYGWEVPDAATLDALAARLEAAGQIVLRYHGDNPTGALADVGTRLAQIAQSQGLVPNANNVIPVIASASRVAC